MVLLSGDLEHPGTLMILRYIFDNFFLITIITQLNIIKSIQEIMQEITVKLRSELFE